MIFFQLHTDYVFFMYIYDLNDFNEFIFIDGFCSSYQDKY